jgi:hypothetical protein
MPNKAMKTFLLLCFFFSLAANVWAQFREPVSHAQTYFLPNQPSRPASTKTFIPGLLADQSQNYRFNSVIPGDQYFVNTRTSGHFAWIGTVTSQSFNNGKFGTFYYWDLQGNLQGSRAFVDLAGKNKRGVKLLFRWR